MRVAHNPFIPERGVPPPRTNPSICVCRDPQTHTCCWHDSLLLPANISLEHRLLHPPAIPFLSGLPCRLCCTIPAPLLSPPCPPPSCPLYHCVLPRTPFILPSRHFPPSLSVLILASRVLYFLFFRSPPGIPTQLPSACRYNPLSILPLRHL